MAKSEGKTTMACSSCRKSPVVRRPSSTPSGNGGIVLPTPEHVNQTMAKNADPRSKVMGLKYVPK